MTLPTWNQLRDRQMMVVDNEWLKAGVYPTVAGSVALAFQRDDESGLQAISFDEDEVQLLAQRLQHALRVAKQDSDGRREHVAAQIAHEVLTRAKGTP